jgi:hypothetical protein
VRVAQTEPDETEKISAYDVARRVLTAAIRDAQHGRIRLRSGVRVLTISRRNADIMSWQAGHKFAAVGDRPFLEVGRKPVGIVEAKLRGALVVPCAREFGDDYEAGDDRGESARRIAGNFFPALLARDWTIKN